MGWALMAITQLESEHMQLALVRKWKTEIKENAHIQKINYKTSINHWLSVFLFARHDSFQLVLDGSKI
jgi:hypothetical protein